MHKCCSKSSKTSWISIDFGPARRISVDHYAIRMDHGSAKAEFRALRNWELQAKNVHDSDWTVLRRHENDETLKLRPYDIAAWPVEVNASGPFQCFRILQFGRNADGGKRNDRWHCLTYMWRYRIVWRHDLC